MIEKIETYGDKETYELGFKLGSQAFEGEIICLTGDLGTGKTVFAKGFAKGLGIEEEISSPTFTIIHEYESGRLPLYHFDVYRLSDISEMDEIGYEEYFFSKGVCLVEWGELFYDLFPKNSRYITIKKDLSRGVDYRCIEIEDR
jgi:tRNA threonylcarbamoyladenosine biosynthesis protein TsaE